MFMSGYEYFHGPKYGGTRVEAFFAESCHSLPCWNNGQAELASIQMPLGVGKISWVQCGRVTNLKETNISLYNFIMIWISGSTGSTGSSPEPWFEWFLELRPMYLGERVLGVLGQSYAYWGVNRPKCSKWVCNLQKWGRLWGASR
jgi:hypothetical protein